jgi:UDP-glucose 4-epimerase
VTDAADRRLTVLVTGGAGFIGSALCHHLTSAGQRVLVYDDLSRGRRGYLPPDVALIAGDIRDGAMLQRAVSSAKPDVVVHLAAMHFIPDCIARPDEARQVNVDGTQRVLECCRADAVRSFIFASTAAVYAPSDDACDEDATPLGPLEIYGETKLEGEQLVRAFHEETGATSTILRLFNAIGHNETNPHVLPHIFESLRTADVVHLGNTTPRRDYIDTRDIAEAIRAVMRSAEGFQVLNVGSGAAYSVDDVIDRLRGILGREITVVQEPARMRTSDRMMLLADTERLRRATDWTPRFALDDTLRDMVVSYGLRVTPG